jgi:hypothetical protein
MRKPCYSEPDNNTYSDKGDSSEESAIYPGNNKLFFSIERDEKEKEPCQPEEDHGKHG